MSTAVGLAGLALTPKASLAAKKPEQLPPQIGDRFQITKGPLKGELLRPGLLKVGEAPVIGFPFAPDGEVLRKKNRLNRLLMVELDPAKMKEETQRTFREWRSHLFRRLYAPWLHHRFLETGGAALSAATVISPSLHASGQRQAADHRTGEEAIWRLCPSAVDDEGFVVATDEVHDENLAPRKSEEED